MKNRRKMKVYYNRDNRPMTIIQGLWFKELGFNVGDEIEVECKRNKVIIKKVHNTGKKK